MLLYVSKSGFAKPTAPTAVPEPAVPTHDAVSHAGYVYHATNVDRAGDIAASGKLNVHRPHEYTEQSSWPDGSTEKRNYFTRNAATAYHFTPEGKGALLRVKEEVHPFRKEQHTGDMYSKQPVPSKHIEMLSTKGTWHGIHEFFPETKKSLILIKSCSKRYFLQDRYRWRGLRIRIETKKGRMRSGVDANGVKWSVRMPWDYGYILGTHSAEHGNDAVDVFVGPKKSSNRVFIVHTKNPETGDYDEDKIFLGFSTISEVFRAFKQAYSHWRKYYGDMEEISFKDFREKVLNTKDAPNVIRGHRVVA